MQAFRKMRKTGRKGNDGGSWPVENLRGRGDGEFRGIRGSEVAR